MLTCEMISSWSDCRVTFKGGHRSHFLHPHPHPHRIRRNLKNKIRIRTASARMQLRCVHLWSWIWRRWWRWWPEGQLGKMKLWCAQLAVKLIDGIQVPTGHAWNTCHTQSLTTPDVAVIAFFIIERRWDVQQFFNSKIMSVARRSANFSNDDKQRLVAIIHDLNCGTTLENKSKEKQF